MKRLLATSILVASLVWGQSATQSIQGLVTDTSGAVVAGAKITITNLNTQVVQTVTTNSTGLYTFPLVPVGDYEIRCEMQGFKTETVRDQRVETAAQLRHDFKMEVGNVTEVIEVSGSGVLLQTENAATGGVIQNKRIIELPLNGRNVVSLAVLIPGVQFGERTGRGDGLGGFPIPGQGFSVSANGVRETHQVVSLDGVDAKDPRIHITNFVPSIEALEEFRIQTNAYSAENGFGGGAVVNMTMKSGTNAIHGTLFYFLRNDKFDAENYFLNLGRDPSQRSKKDKLRRNQYGVVVSGPIFKNKTFWAFNWESRRERTEAVQEAFFPNDAFRAGNFSELLTPPTGANGSPIRAPIQLFDPFTGQAFPGNIIPASRIHPGMKSVMDQFLPRAEFRPLDPLDISARKGINQPINTNQYFARVDHFFNDKDRIFGRLAVDRSSKENNFMNPNFPVITPSAVTNIASQWVHMFSTNMINEFRYGFNISDDTLTSLHNTGNFDVDSLGIGEYRVPLDGNRKLTPREQGVPLLGFTIGERINGNGLDRMDTHQFGNHLTWIRGKHNLKMGGEIYRISMERAGANLAQGSIAFSANETGNNFASFLLGLPNTTQTPEGEPKTFPRSTRSGIYMQDDWKVSPKLTLNLGFRFDYIGVPRDAQGLWRTFDFVGEGENVGRGGGYRTPDGRLIPTIYPSTVDENGAVKLWKQDTKFFMPRIGIAYRPTEKWVLRLGAGWFDNIQHMNNWTIMNLMPPKSGSLLYSSITDTIPGTTFRRYRDGQPIITMSDPFLTRTTATAAVRPVAVVHAKPDTKDPHVYKWSFDVQRELPSNMAITIGYVGNKGTHTGNSIGNYNDALPSSNTDIQSRRPFQQFYDPAIPQRGIQTVSTIRYLDSYGNSFYHGLQLKFDKRFSRGLTGGLAYTYSKAHGDGEAGGNEGAFFQNPRDRLASRGRYRFDQTQNFVANFVWELPGQNMTGPVRHLIGGWQSNGIVSLRSGFPFTPSQGGDLNTGSNARPDRLQDGALSNASRDLWYNPQAFSRVTCNIAARPDLCHYGNSGVNILTGPGQHNFDLSLYKNFQLNERMKLQFRSEFFNAFNSPFFGDPNNLSFASVNSLVPDAPRVGEVRSLRTPMRIIQFGLKMFF